MPSKDSFTPFTTMCAKYLFWFVNRPNTYSIDMFNDWVSNNIKNSRLDSLSSGFLLVFTFFMSTTPLFCAYFYLPFAPSFLLEFIVPCFVCFFSWTFYLKTIFFISAWFLLSSFSYNCFTIYVIKAYSPFKINSLIRLSNCILRSSNESLELGKNYHMKFQLVDFVCLLFSAFTFFNESEAL